VGHCPCSTVVLIVLREETLEKIRQKETAIATLDEALSKQKLQMMELENVIDCLRYGLKKEKAAIAPITLLPPEILYRIFLSSLGFRFGNVWDDYVEDEAELAEHVRRLSLVSKLWQSVIEHGPRIWTAGAFHEGGPHVARVQRWISRSGDLPLQAVLNMRLGNPLRVFWTKHIGQVLSRISSVWIKVPTPNPRAPDDDPETCHESLRLLGTAECLTELVISSFRFHDPAVMEDLGVLHFPALQLFRATNSDVLPMEAPCLRTLAISECSTICGSHLWNMITKASRLERLSLRGPTVLPVWDEHPPIPELQHLHDLALIISRQVDHPPYPDQFQMNILNACHPSALQTVTIDLTTTFWRCNLDFLPRFTSLSYLCLKLISQRPVLGGSYRSMVAIINLLEKMPNLETLRLIGKPMKREVTYEFDLLVQAFLLPEDPKVVKLCPRLKSIHLIFGLLHWPMLLHRMFHDRLGATATPTAGLEAKPTFSLLLVTVGLKHGMKHVPKRERKVSFTNTGWTNEKSLQAFERLMRTAGLGPEPDRLKPAFDIPCPKQRLAFLCDLLGHTIIPQSEPDPKMGTGNE
jgi:hypothetical protein